MKRFAVQIATALLCFSLCLAAEDEFFPKPGWIETPNPAADVENAMEGGNTIFASSGMNASETTYQKDQGIEDSTDLFIQETIERRTCRRRPCPRRRCRNRRRPGPPQQRQQR